MLAAKKIIANEDMQSSMELMKTGCKTYHFDIKFEATDSNNQYLKY